MRRAQLLGRLGEQHSRSLNSRTDEPAAERAGAEAKETTQMNTITLMIEMSALAATMLMMWTFAAPALLMN
jgi:hypothetical protein